MLVRLAIAGATMVALSTAPVVAGPVNILGLALACVLSQAQTTQCAIQHVEDGDGNAAWTRQTYVQHSSGNSLQLGVTVQNGNGNRSFIGQYGEDQVALSLQSGNDNGSFTHQEGEDQLSATVQLGDGHWAGTSSIGEDTATVVVQTN